MRVSVVMHLEVTLKVKARNKDGAVGEAVAALQSAISTIPRGKVHGGPGKRVGLRRLEMVCVGITPEADS